VVLVLQKKKIEFKESQKYKDLYKKYFVDMPWLDM